ncbi:hypothetical protein D0Z00_001391 [Geotrichum galactomycetum]|uniref:Uncharacterized protein n=1 Tax=Geotrichum galactomycetum TaxID=27317 RepID=A0ACB6V7H9_9ASCO|nr:hypothetical protein D0Z00_001391 [Geotrichum candidum]
MFEYAFQDFFNPTGAEAAAGMWGAMLLLLGPVFYAWEYRAKWLEIAERGVFVRKPGNPAAQAALLRVWRNLAYMSADRPLSAPNASGSKDLKMMVAPLRHLVSTTSVPAVLNEAVDNWVRVVYSCLSPTCVYSAKEELGLVWVRAVENCVCTMLLADNQRPRILAVVKQLLFPRSPVQSGPFTPGNSILASPSKSGAHYHNHTTAPTRWFAARILEGEVFELNDLPGFPSKWTRANYRLIRATLLDTILPQCINNNGTEQFVEIWKLFVSLLVAPLAKKESAEHDGDEDMFMLTINDSLTVLEKLKGGSDYGLLVHLVNAFEAGFNKILTLPFGDFPVYTIDASLRIVVSADQAGVESKPTEKTHQINPLTLFWTILLKQQQVVSAVGRPDVKLLTTYRPLSTDVLRELSSVLTNCAFDSQFELEPLWLKLYSVVFNSSDPSVYQDMAIVNNLVRLHTCIKYVVNFKEPWAGFLTYSFSQSEPDNEGSTATTQLDAPSEAMTCWLKCLEKMDSLIPNSALLEEYCRDVLKSTPHAEVFFNHLCYTAIKQQLAATATMSPKQQKSSELSNHYSTLFQSVQFEELLNHVLTSPDMLPETIALGYKLLQVLYFQHGSLDCLLDEQVALLRRLAQLELGSKSQWYAFWREFMERLEALGLSSRSQLFKGRGKRKNRGTASVKYCYEWSPRVVNFFIALYSHGTTGLSSLVKQALTRFAERHTKLSMPKKLLAIVDDNNGNMKIDPEFTLQAFYKRAGSSKGAEVSHIVNKAQQIPSENEQEMESVHGLKYEQDQPIPSTATDEAIQVDAIMIDELPVVVQPKTEKQPEGYEKPHEVFHSAMELNSTASVDLTHDQVVDMEIDSPVPDLVHTPRKHTSGESAGDTVPVIDVSSVTSSSSAPTSSDDEYHYKKRRTLRSARLNSKSGMPTSVRIVEPEETDTVATEEELSLHGSAQTKPVSTNGADDGVEMTEAVVIFGDDASDDHTAQATQGSQRRSKRKAAREAAAAFTSTEDKKRKRPSSSSSVESGDPPRKSKRSKSIYKNKPEVCSLMTALEQYTREFQKNWPSVASTPSRGNKDDSLGQEEEKIVELSIKDKQRAFELETRLIEALSQTRKLIISNSYN